MGALNVQYITVYIPQSQDQVRRYLARAMHYNICSSESGAWDIVPCKCNILQFMFLGRRTMVRSALHVQYITVYILQRQNHGTWYLTRAIHYNLYSPESGSRAADDHWLLQSPDRPRGGRVPGGCLETHVAKGPGCHPGSHQGHNFWWQALLHARSHRPERRSRQSACFAS